MSALIAAVLITVFGILILMFSATGIFYDQAPAGAVGVVFLVGTLVTLLGGTLLHDAAADKVRTTAQRTECQLAERAVWVETAVTIPNGESVRCLLVDERGRTLLKPYPLRVLPENDKNGVER